MTAPALPAIVEATAGLRKLRQRADVVEPGWTCWEIRTLNLHRVVGLMRANRPFASAGELETEIRGVLSRAFKRSWWRGIAYGVVVDIGTISLSPEDLKTLVDVRENEKGTLQWVVLVSTGARIALGVHTWIEGYLSPVYRAMLQALMPLGYKVTSVRKEKDGLMKFLTSVAEGKAAIATFGSRRAFPEFRNLDTSRELRPPSVEAARRQQDTRND